MKTKKKKKKLRVKVLIILLFFIYVVYQVVIYLINIPVDDVIIQGSNIVSNQEILELSNINSDTKFLFLISNSIENKLIENIYIKSAEVDKTLFGDITITIEENKTLFYYSYNNSLVLEGDVYTTEYTSLLGIPTLINYTPSDILSNFISKLSLIDQSLINKISEIEYSPNIKDGIILDEERFIFKMNDGNTVHVNVINLEKFSNYDSILEVESQKGTIYLDSSNDGNVFEFYE